MAAANRKVLFLSMTIAPFLTEKIDRPVSRQLRCTRASRRPRVGQGCVLSTKCHERYAADGRRHHSNLEGVAFCSSFNLFNVNFLLYDNTGAVPRAAGYHRMRRLVGHNLAKGGCAGSDANAKSCLE